MILFSSAWHLLSAFLVWSFGLILIIGISGKFNIKRRRSIILYFWHTFFCIFYANYVAIEGGDAIDYYYKSISSSVDFSLGTVAVVYLTRLFSYYLDISFIGAFLVYNIFGTIGLLGFDGSLRHASYKKTKIVRIFASLLVFLPSVSFWSAAIGKDALSFMATGLALWAAIDFNSRIRLMIFSIVLMLFVRPHMAGLMIIAVAGSMIFRGRLSLVRKSFLIILSFVASIVLIPFAMEYSGLGSMIGFEDVQDYVEQRQGYNMEGGGGIDISSLSPPLQLLTYLFRPLPFEAHTILALAASFDNTILIVLFIFGIIGIFKFRRYDKIYFRENVAFMWIYSLSAWLILAITTANLGISVRQKWMFVPVLAFLLISLMTKRNQERQST